MGEMIKFGIKMALVIAASATFLTAIMTILNLLTQVVQGSVVGEVFGIFNACLPFDLGNVMGGITNAGAAILSFMVAQKIFALVQDSAIAVS